MAQEYTLSIQVGLPWSVQLAVKNPDGSIKNLTGFTASCQIRQSVNTDTVLLTPTVVITDAVNGKLCMYLSAAQTAGASSTNAVYDVEITDTNIGTVFRILQGAARIMNNNGGQDYPTTVYQGADWALAVLVNGPDGHIRDFTGYTAHILFKRSRESPDYIARYTCAIDISHGSITASLIAAQTSIFDPTIGYYAIYADNGVTDTFKVLQGPVKFSFEVTRT